MKIDVDVDVDIVNGGKLPSKDNAISPVMTTDDTFMAITHTIDDNIYSNDVASNNECATTSSMEPANIITTTTIPCTDDNGNDNEYPEDLHLHETTSNDSMKIVNYLKQQQSIKGNCKS